MKRSFLAAALSIFLTAASLSLAADPKPVKVAAKDRCPVCGMFVAKYPHFAAEVRFRDGATFHFDGAKDMFKFYQDPSRYAPRKQAADIAGIFVTDYYRLTMVDGFVAYYVVGSDVLGPMGQELVPFAGESQAREFLNDHKGKAIYRFRDVTRAVLRALH